MSHAHQNVRHCDSILQTHSKCTGLSCRAKFQGITNMSNSEHQPLFSDSLKFNHAWQTFAFWVCLKKRSTMSYIFKCMWYPIKLVIIKNFCTDPVKKSKFLWDTFFINFEKLSVLFKFSFILVILSIMSFMYDNWKCIF